MTIYHFAVRNGAGDKEGLGKFDLVNDKDASTFAASVIEDVTYEYAPQYLVRLWKLPIKNASLLD